MEGDATQMIDFVKHHYSPNTNNELDSIRKLQQPFSIERNPISFENQLEILSSAGKMDTYFEKRKKNNESAKRSRLARNKREQDLVKKVLLLEKQNLALKTQVNALKEKIKQHRVRFMTNFFSI